MKRDIYTMIRQDLNTSGNTLYFDFYNSRGIFVGFLIVADTGKAQWRIINIDYENLIKQKLYFVIGEESQKHLSGETIGDNRNIWYNAWKLALSLFYLQKQEQLLKAREYNYGFPKKRKTQQRKKQKRA